MDEFFGASGFVGRGECGSWAEGMPHVYAMANLATTFAYVAIGIILWMAIRQEARVVSVADLTRPQKNHLRATYATFIVSCGVGHLDGVVAFFWPAYHLFAVWHVFTAAASWYAVAVTFHFRTHILADI